MARAIVDLEPGSSSICSSEELRLLKEEPQDTAHQVLGPQAARAPTRHDKLNPPTTPCEPRAPASKQPGSARAGAPKDVSAVPIRQAHDLQASGQDLQRAAEAVVPSWDEDSAYLILPLPSALAHVWARIRLEVGGVMLPPALTERWRVAHVQKHGQGQGAPYCIKGMYWDVKGWLSGAQLLTCSARMCDEQPDQWELVVRVRWPPAPGLYEKGAVNEAAFPQCVTSTDEAELKFYQCYLRVPISLLHSLGMIPRTGRRPCSIPLLLAFKLDGRFVPLQQPVELQRVQHTYQVRGWPGLGSLLKGAHITGCERWLPAAGTPAHGVAASIQSSLSTPASNMPACSDSGNMLPGLLVLCLATGHRPSTQHHLRSAGDMAALPSQSSSTDLTSTSSSSSDTSEEGESGEMDASTSDDGGLQAPAGAAPGPAPGEGTETGAGVSHPSVRTQPQLPQLYETHKHQQGLSQATGMDMSSAGDVQHHGRKRGRDAVAGDPEPQAKWSRASMPGRGASRKRGSWRSGAGSQVPQGVVIRQKQVQEQEVMTDAEPHAEASRQDSMQVQQQQVLQQQKQVLFQPMPVPTPEAQMKPAAVNGVGNRQHQASVVNHAGQPLIPSASAHKADTRQQVLQSSTTWQQPSPPHQSSQPSSTPAYIKAPDLQPSADCAPPQAGGAQHKPPLQAAPAPRATPCGPAQGTHTLQQPQAQPQPQPQQAAQPLPLTKRVARLMSKMVDPSRGAVSAGELVDVLTNLQAEGTDRALHLASVLGSIPIGSTVSEEACNALSKAVFSWHAAHI